MASLIRSLANAATSAVKAAPPVDYVGPQQRFVTSLSGRNRTHEQNVHSMGANGTLYAIVDLLATSTASVKWHLWRPDPNDMDKREEVTRHLALDTLNRPNPFYTRQELFETCQQHMELTGEAWIVMVQNALGWPIQLWPIRPDRMEVVPDPDQFIAGYKYWGPSGEPVPLDVSQVMSIRIPNPADPFRGLGPVQSILLDAKLIRNAKTWNANWFANGAEPGGLIELGRELSDPEFNKFRARWAETHRGVNNAHRVGLLEGGAKWVDRKYTHQDMQFTELQNVSDTAIRTAFAIHGHMLGLAEDVNLANATAAEVTFARRKTVPRLERWDGMLNSDYLPLFGPNPTGLYFEPEDPVQVDIASNAEVFYQRARGTMMLVQAGFDGNEAADAAGLPPIAWDADRVLRSNTEVGRTPGEEENENSNWEKYPPQAKSGGRHRPRPLTSTRSD